MTLTRDGLREILIGTLLLGGGGAVAAWGAITVSPWLWLVAGPLLALWLFVLAFFRDPRRTTPHEEGLLIAPADGKVSDITPLTDYEGIDGPALRIGIFLSVFDVHINRAPCDGRVIKTAYSPGGFLDARHPEAGAKNEANAIFIEADSGMNAPIIVRQIAGLIARRIVCHVGDGDILKRGRKFGMIKFGSRTELIVQAESGFVPAVQVGDRVRAGSTILMRLPQPSENPDKASHRRIEQELASSDASLNDTPVAS